MGRRQNIGKVNEKYRRPEGSKNMERRIAEYYSEEHWTRGTDNMGRRAIEKWTEGQKMLARRSTEYKREDWQNI
jgi:hypothetical protein